MYAYFYFCVQIRLFGADAVLASQVLSIGHLAIPGRETAFFPKTNLYVHLSRMIMAGHKVGLFTQSETRSLRNAEPPGKKGGSKSRVFSRQLSGVYSLSTWTETDPNGGALSTPETESVLVQNWITSFHATTDPHSQKEAHVQLSMVAICPQSGEILWDSWRDDPIRSMLETRMTYLRPVEILVPLSGLDASSEKLISWLINEYVFSPCPILCCTFSGKMCSHISPSQALRSCLPPS
jgi:DNA mismatch repair protein MSH3